VHIINGQPTRLLARRDWVGMENRELDRIELNDRALVLDVHEDVALPVRHRGLRFATERQCANDRVADGIDRRSRERTNSAVELAAGARGRLRQGDRAGALAMASQALHQDPSDQEVRTTFSTIERARVAEVAKQLLARHRVPKRIKDVTNELRLAHNLSSAEIELAGRVDGRWDLLSLIKSASVREAEALLAFARLAEVGVVELG